MLPVRRRPILVAVSSLLALLTVSLVPSIRGAGEGPKPGPDPLAQLKERESRIKAVAADCMASVVAITTERPIGTGSGVIVSADGLILTAAHVTKAITDSDHRDVVIIFPDGQQVKGVSLGLNETCDCGMVKITEPAGNAWPHVELGASDDIRRGDWVVAMGQPGGYDPKRTPPVRAGRVWGRDHFGNFFTDCTLVGGDSGGPLFDLEGKLIGIHSSIGGPLTINRHVPLENFRADWDRLLKGDRWGELALGETEPQRPVIGARLDEAAEGPAGGVRVLEIITNGPAEKAGLKKDDLITGFAGHPISNYVSFVRWVSRQVPGDTVKLAVRRGIDKDAADVEVSLTLASPAAIRRSGGAPPPSAAPPRGWLGIDIEEAAGDVKGAVISSIAADSPAAKAGLAEKDVITALNGGEIKDAVELAKALASLPVDAKIKLKFKRGAEEKELEVQLSPPPSRP